MCVIQKRAIRTIHKLGYTEHTDPFFKLNNILTLDNLHVLQVCMYIFKSVTNVGSFNIFNKLHIFYKFIFPKYKLSKTQHNIYFTEEFNLLPRMFI